MILWLRCAAKARRHWGYSRSVPASGAYSDWTGVPDDTRKDTRKGGWRPSRHETRLMHESTSEGTQQ